jgi:hypothetical protein
MTHFEVTDQDRREAERLMANLMAGRLDDGDSVIPVEYIRPTNAVRAPRTRRAERTTRREPDPA